MSIKKELLRKRVVFYTRFSTASDQQKANSTARQTKLLNNFVKEYGVIKVAEYHDEASSGTKFGKELNQLITDFKEGKLEPFDYVLAEDLSRVSRQSQYRTDNFLAPLFDAGISLLFASKEGDQQIYHPETTGDDLAASITHTFESHKNKEYVTDTSKRIIHDQLGKAKDAKLPPNKSYGWIVKKEISNTRRVGSWELLPHPVEAPIVKEMFETFVSQKSVLGLIPILQKDKKMAARKRIYNSQIKSILRNPKHAGYYTRFQQRTGKAHVVKNGEVVKVKNFGSSDERVSAFANHIKTAGVVIEDHHQGIISKALFLEVQKILDANQQMKKEQHTNRRPTKYKYSGKLLCECGCKLSSDIKKYQNREEIYYKCLRSSSNKYQDCEGKKQISEKIVDEIFKEGLKEVLCSEEFHANAVRLVIEKAVRWRINNEANGNSEVLELQKKKSKLEKQYQQELQSDDLSARVLADLDKLISGIDKEIQQLQQDKNEDGWDQLFNSLNLNFPKNYDSKNVPAFKRAGHNPDEYLKQVLKGAGYLVLMQEYYQEKVYFEDGSLNEDVVEEFIKTRAVSLASSYRFRFRKDKVFLDDWISLVDVVQVKWMLVEELKENSRAGKLGHKALMKNQKRAPFDYSVKFKLPPELVASVAEPGDCSNTSTAIHTFPQIELVG